MSLGAQFFANGFIYATFVARLSEVRDQAGVSTAELGLTLSAGSFVALVASFFTGFAVRRAGSQRILVAGGLFYATALVGIGASRSGAVLVATLVLLAAFDVFVDVAMNLQASIISAQRPRPVMSRLHGIWSVGALAGGVTAAGAAQLGIPLVAHYCTVAGIAIVALLIITPGLLRGDKPHPLQHHPAVGSRTRRWALLGAAAISLAIANAMAETLEIATGEWAGLRVRDDLGADAGVAAAVFAVFTIAMACGRLLGDHAVSSFGAARTVRGGLAIAVAGVLLATLPGSIALALAGVVMIGLGISVLAPQLADAAARAPGRPGGGFTALFIGHRAAGLYTPAAIGLLAGTSALSVGSAMALIMIPSAILLAGIIGPVLRLPHDSESRSVRPHKRVARRADRHPD
ncbi:MFS transporter [Kribbella sp. CA-253562]|uniref:MFS transporter n=1 Tax=Kribbella sp. CA-253562 TaxID=3239942 RepID=UPI003D8CB59F